MVPYEHPVNKYFVFGILFGFSILTFGVYYEDITSVIFGGVTCLLFVITDSIMDCYLTNRRQGDIESQEESF